MASNPYEWREDVEKGRKFRWRRDPMLFDAVLSGTSEKWYAEWYYVWQVQWIEPDGSWGPAMNYGELPGMS